MFLTLAPWDQRSRSQAEITSQLNRELQRIPGVQVFARTSNSLGIRGGGQGLQFAITGTDYDQLSGVADKLVQAMEKDPVFDRVQLNYDTTQPQMAIKIDRQRATDVGISVDTISAAVQTILSGKDLGNYYIGDDADRDPRQGARRHGPGLQRARQHAAAHQGREDGAAVLAGLVPRVGRGAQPAAPGPAPRHPHRRHARRRRRPAPGDERAAVDRGQGPARQQRTGLHRRGQGAEQRHQRRRADLRLRAASSCCSCSPASSRASPAPSSSSPPCPSVWPRRSSPSSSPTARSTSTARSGWSCWSA